jgi:kinesin family member 11
MCKMADSLIDQGSREDTPTGNTPRKRVWQYTDSWELTKDRDTIIEGWKRRAVQPQDDECVSSSLCLSPTFPPDTLRHPVLPSVQVAARPANVTEQLDPLPPPYLENDIEEPPTSNFPLPSMAPLVVPAVALPGAISNPTMKTKIGKSGSEVIPAMGTLTERSTNLIYGRGARRAR